METFYFKLPDEFSNLFGRIKELIDSSNASGYNKTKNGNYSEITVEFKSLQDKQLFIERMQKSRLGFTLS
jgi:hypothetical protein